MAATRQDPASRGDGSAPGDPAASAGTTGGSGTTSRARATKRARTADTEARDDAGVWGVIEVQTAALVRNLELIRRRGDFSTTLDRSGYLLLRTLESIGPADINTLAAAVGLDPSTAGRQLADLRKKGLIDRAPAPTDRRRSIISPTTEGRRRADEVQRQRLNQTRTLLAGWTGEELHALSDVFTRFNRTIAEHYLGAEHHLGAGPGGRNRTEPTPDDEHRNDDRHPDRKENPQDG